MVIKKEHLDIRICDFYKGNDFANTETFREYIRSTESEFDLIPKDLEGITDKQLDSYLDYLDYLWEK